MYTWFTEKRLLPVWLEVGLLCLAGSLLMFGTSWQLSSKQSDGARYQCYAQAFWQGWQGLNNLPAQQCTFLTRPDADTTAITQDMLIESIQHISLPEPMRQVIEQQDPRQPGHTLPYEYPPLLLLFFSLALIVPVAWYQVAFAVEMLLIALALYGLLRSCYSQRVALIYCFYLVIGGWSTLAGRFDIIAVTLTILTLIFAERQFWRRAFFCLGLAIMTKFYPAVLLLPLWLEHQQNVQGRWWQWKRWQPLLIGVAVCVVLVLISLCLSVAGTVSPLSYLRSRPIQIESLAASLLWLAQLAGLATTSYGYSFGSLNVISTWSDALSLLTTVLLMAGLIAVLWLQWKKCIQLAQAMLLTLLVVIVTGKVFSPQYMIWIIPLLAICGRDRSWWLWWWLLILLLTTWIYPHIYRMQPLASNPFFFISAALRNLLLLAFLVVWLFLLWRRAEHD